MTDDLIEKLSTIATIMEFAQSNKWPQHIDADITNEILIKALKDTLESTVTK